MHEQKVLKIAFICSLFGIIFLFYLSQTAELGDKALNEIKEEDIGKTFRMNGKVVKVSEKNDSIAVTIMQETTTTAFFDPSEKIPAEGSFIEFRGKINEYNGRTIIEGKGITLIKT